MNTWAVTSTTKASVMIRRATTASDEKPYLGSAVRWLNRHPALPSFPSIRLYVSCRVDSTLQGVELNQNVHTALEGMCDEISQACEPQLEELEQVAFGLTCGELGDRPPGKSLRIKPVMAPKVVSIGGRRLTINIRIGMAITASDALREDIIEAAHRTLEGIDLTAL